MIQLLILLNLCHWLADYTWLSTDWMLKAKRFGKPLYPILCHAFVHSFLMGVILQIWYPQARWLFFIQLITHFSIDVLKGRFNVWFPKVSAPSNVIHWAVFGADQFAHQMVIIFMAWIATN